MHVTAIMAMLHGFEEFKQFFLFVFAHPVALSAMWACPRFWETFVYQDGFINIAHFIFPFLLPYSQLAQESAPLPERLRRTALVTSFQALVRTFSALTLQSLYPLPDLRNCTVSPLRPRTTPSVFFLSLSFPSFALPLSR